MTRLQRSAWLAVALPFAFASSVLAADLKDPASNAFAVTPSDTVSIPETTWLYVVQPGTSDLVVTLAGNNGAGTGGKVTLTKIPTGMYQLRVTQVWATGTGVTNIVALYP